VFQQSSALKLFKTKKRSSELGSRFLIKIRITCGVPAKLRFENKKSKLINSSKLDLKFGFFVYS
jgi:hypothetical protein